MSPCVTYAILLAAIVLEVVGTSALVASDQVTRLAPSTVVVACCSGALILISVTLHTIPVGIVYAIWSGVVLNLVSGSLTQGG